MGVVGHSRKARLIWFHAVLSKPNARHTRHALPMPWLLLCDSVCCCLGWFFQYYALTRRQMNETSIVRQLCRLTCLELTWVPSRIIDLVGIAGKEPQPHQHQPVARVTVEILISNSLGVKTVATTMNKSSLQDVWSRCRTCKRWPCKNRAMSSSLETSSMTTSTVINQNSNAISPSFVSVGGFPCMHIPMYLQLPPTYTDSIYLYRPLTSWLTATATLEHLITVTTTNR